MKKGRPKKTPKFKDVLQRLLPMKDIFTEEEIPMYEGLISIYLKDFDESQLTANDVDDIMAIAMNKVLETRLFKASKDDTNMQIDASTAIERLRKQTEKLKDNLAARRKDRIDPKKYSGFSIVDIAVAFDTERKNEAYERIATLKAEEEEISKSKQLIGNSEDPDADIIEEE